LKIRSTLSPKVYLEDRKNLQEIVIEMKGPDHWPAFPGKRRAFQPGCLPAPTFPKEILAFPLKFRRLSRHKSELFLEKS